MSSERLLWRVRGSQRRPPAMGRVGMWRGGVRSTMSVAAPFVWRCLSGSAITPFPHPAHRTQQADFPQSVKRKVVVVIRERGPEGKTLPGVFPTEADALGFIRRNLAPQ